MTHDYLQFSRYYAVFKVLAGIYPAVWLFTMLLNFLLIATGGG